MIDLTIVMVCLVLNALFSAYEMAFVTISKDGVEDLGRRLIQFKKRPERILSVIQIGITLVGVIAAAVGGTGAVEELRPYLIKNYQLNETMAEVAAISLVIIPLTYFSVVFGELVPKAIALRYPKKILSHGTNLISFIDRLLHPIVSFLEISTGGMLKLLKLNSFEDQQKIPEVIDIGNLPAYHRNFVNNLISLKGRKIEDIMIGQDKVCYLEFSETDQEVGVKLRRTSHSRFPVVDGELLVGVFHVKEWGGTINESIIPWQSLIGPALKVSPREKVLEAFLKMQKSNHHMAIVMDESGHFSGIVTIEDIVEQIVGDIKDDLERNKITKLLSRRERMNIHSDGQLKS